jgi:glycyl-tRNA synthetase
MFKTIVGALGSDDDAAFLRPETAQGSSVNFKNVLDSSRVGIPFGICQVGKSFRNEITPRNFTFPFARIRTNGTRVLLPIQKHSAWLLIPAAIVVSIGTLKHGLAAERLRLREHAAEDIRSYSCGTADIEYAFPFLPAGDYGELEGIAHRADFEVEVTWKANW